jgi:UDP-glucuronate decarboxylase
VDDLVEGLLRMMDSWNVVIGPVNLGNTHEIEVRQLAEHVLALTSSLSRLVFPPLPQDDPLHRRPDITRARNLLEWEPAVPLHEGLARTVRYFRRLLSSSDGPTREIAARPNG